jgi:hypothetical protein
MVPSKAVTNPYLRPVGPLWARAAGFVLLLAGTGLAAYLARLLMILVTDERARRLATSSSAISALILLALCGFCWQAGFRLASSRQDRIGPLFSRPGWIAIGAGMVMMAMLMTYAILSRRSPTWVDFQVIISLATLGVWCFVLAWRGR